MMPAVVASNAPAYVRYNASPASVSHTEPFEIGRAEQLGDGRDVTLLTYGFLLREAEKARAKLESEGARVRLLNMRTLKPVDQESILRAARETKLLVTIEDHFQTGGLYTVVAETLLANTVTCPTLGIAFAERWFKPGRLDDVLEHEGLTGAHIAAKVRARLER